MKGDYIGELEIFKQTGYISRIQSRGKVRILELDRTFFLQWIRTDKNFNEYMIRTLCDNSYRMCLNMGENTLYTLKQRICQYLLRNMEMDAKFVMISFRSFKSADGGDNKKCQPGIKTVKRTGIY